MDHGLKRLAVICARGGSKGVKGKNLRLLAGKPLLAHSIEQARQSGAFDVIAVSSDSPEILAAAQKWGTDCLITRPPDLASDTAPKVPAIRHCLQAAERERGLRFDTVVDLDATAPLRIAADITGAIALLEDGDADNVVTGMPSRRSPYFNLVELNDQSRVVLSKPPDSYIARRQDSPPCFDLNASVFVWRRDVLLAGSDRVLGDNTQLYVMPEERSIDIDTETDFRFVEFILAGKDQHE